MKYSPYSHSKVSTYYQCPMKFKLNYIDKVKVPFISNKALLKGSHIHKILENNFNFETQFETNLIYTNEDFKQTIEIVKHFKESEIGKEIGKLINIGVKEENFAFDKDFNQSNYFGKNTFFRGSSDLYYIKDETCFIFDYKSGKDKSEDDEFGVDQSMVYAIDIFLRKPEIKTVKAFFIFVEHNSKKKITYNRDSLESYKTKLLNQIQKCEEDVFFKKNTSPLCDYCSFKEFGYCNGQEEFKEPERMSLDF